MRLCWRIGGIMAMGLAMGGCAGPGVVGETEFSCPGYPSHPTCMSVRDMYAATEAADQVIADESGKASESAHKILGQSVATQTSGGTSPTPAEQAARVASHMAAARAERKGDTLSPRIDDPIPIRTPARVMRIWIAPWEDEAGDLHVSGYVYTEVEKRRWMIGERPVSQGTRIRPLQVERRKGVASAAVQPGAK